MTSQYGRACYDWTLAICLCLVAIRFGVVQAHEKQEFNYAAGPKGPAAHWGDLNVDTFGVAKAQERRLEESAEAPEATEVRFDYSNGPNGPENWGQFNSICKEGKHQSPIEITPHIMRIDSGLRELDADYPSEPVAANIKINEGDGVEVTVDPETSGLLRINGVEYKPRQFHFHMGSEHKILNHRFPMELHLVHATDDKPVPKRAVISWLFVKGNESPFLAQFADKLPSPSSYPKNFTMEDPIALPKLEKSYARYTGSLTTPNCTEGVVWTVMLWNFPTISERQLELFKAAMPIENVRPLQKSNHRHVSIYTDS